MRVNYDKIAAYYDRHRSGGGPYMTRLLALLEKAPGNRALEIGAGTGNNTQAMLETAGCALTAIEPSQGMLSQARQKDLKADWVRASGMALPFQKDSFDFLFAVYVLQYIQDLRRFLEECHRILAPDAHAAFITAPTDFIRKHAMNQYFPSFAKVDLARFAPIETIEAAFQSAGFREVEHEIVQGPPRKVGRAYVERVASRFISTYDLLPDEEFKAGVQRLRADIEATPEGELDLDVTWRCAVIWGVK